MEKTQHKVVILDPYEHGFIITALNDKRNEMLKERKPTDIADDVLLKVIDAPSRKVRVRDDEAR